MHRSKRIAIILADILQSTGLQSILADYFAPVEICYFPAFEELSAAGHDNFDYYFTHSDTFVLNADYFLPRRNKTILLLCNKETVPGTSASTYYLNVCSSQETIIEQLQSLFIDDNTNNVIPGEGNKELSVRETDVLQLIVKGITNKEIADKLNISLNTVLTHRKNITTKLGIKTVSGLTFYAIMNGIISGDEIEL